MQIKQVVLETSRRLGFAIRVLIDVVSNVSFRLLYFNTRKGLPPVTNKILLLSATGKPSSWYLIKVKTSHSNRIGS